MNTEAIQRPGMGRGRVCRVLRSALSVSKTAHRGGSLSFPGSGMTPGRFFSPFPAAETLKRDFVSQCGERKRREGFSGEGSRRRECAPQDRMRGFYPAGMRCRAGMEDRRPACPAGRYPGCRLLHRQAGTPVFRKAEIWQIRKCSPTGSASCRPTNPSREEARWRR